MGLITYWNNVGCRVYTGMVSFMAASEGDAKGICDRHNEKEKELRKDLTNLKLSNSKLMENQNLENYSEDEANLFSEIKDFIDKNGTKEFKPFAYYDKHLDCIRIRFKDCSMVEERISKALTIVRSSHGEELVGINIKGIRYLCENLKWAPSVCISVLTFILNKLAEKYPDEMASMIEDVIVEWIK